ncbi:MAG: M20 family metallopeptidase, partial [Solirubrobacterales bacterium]
QEAGLRVDAREHGGMPLIVAEAGPVSGPAVVFHGHLDVVPGCAEQFVPRVEGDRLIGRGAFDMKGALAAMLCAMGDVAGQDAVRVVFACVPDEESEQVDDRATDAFVQDGLEASFAITGEPTDLHVGVQSKGLLAVQLEVRGTAAHGSTPWLGDNAVLKAHDVFRRIETLPFSRQSSELFDRPSINLSRISGGDAINKVPDRCLIDVDIRYLPGQDAGEILEQVAALPDVEIVQTLERVPAVVAPDDPYVLALREAAGASGDSASLSVGRDGASDAQYFLDAGIPAVEFGPVGAGHHGPEEWVSIASLADYRRALGGFVEAVGALGAAPPLRAIEGGLAS